MRIFLKKSYIFNYLPYSNDSLDVQDSKRSLVSPVKISTLSKGPKFSVNAYLAILVKGQNLIKSTPPTHTLCAETERLVIICTNVAVSTISKILDVQRQSYSVLDFFSVPGSDQLWLFKLSSHWLIYPFLKCLGSTYQVPDAGVQEWVIYVSSCHGISDWAGQTNKEANPREKWVWVPSKIWNCFSVSEL